MSGVLELVSLNNGGSSHQQQQQQQPGVRSSSPIPETPKNQKVIVVIHKTASKHFAVLYPFWGLVSAKRPICSINLKTTMVEKSRRDPEHEFRIVPARDFEGTSLTFRITESGGSKMSEGQSIDSWINALRSSQECATHVNVKTLSSGITSKLANSGKVCYRKASLVNSRLLSVLAEDEELEDGSS